MFCSLAVNIGAKFSKFSWGQIFKILFIMFCSLAVNIGAKFSNLSWGQIFIFKTDGRLW